MTSSVYQQASGLTPVAVTLRRDEAQRQLQSYFAKGVGWPGPFAILSYVTTERDGYGRDGYGQADVENRWLGRMNRRRLEFEALRDTMLAISGRLEQPIGGRPVNVASDPKNRRRTVYGLVDRQSLPDVYRSFDFASPDQSVERRPRTVVPQQALFALNSEFVTEQARALAARVAAEAPGDHERIKALYRIAYQREPTDDETKICREFLAEVPERDSKLSPWEQLCQVLLVGNETMYID